MFNFSSNHLGHFLQIQSAAVGVTRQLLSAAPERAALISRTKTQAEVRWKLPTIERCCARLQMILQFARSPCFWYCCRLIASVGQRSTDFPTVVSRQTAAGRVACARSIVEQHLVSARQRHC